VKPFKAAEEASPYGHIAEEQTLDGNGSGPAEFNGCTGAKGTTVYPRVAETA
jgi:hypothetical protein